MSFGTAALRFAAQAARERVAAFGTPILTAETPARRLTVFLGPWQVVRELGEVGMLESVRAQLRVPLAVDWSAEVGEELTVESTGEVARIASRATHPSAAEIVCDVVRRNS